MVFTVTTFVTAITIVAFIVVILVGTILPIAAADDYWLLNTAS
jgi:hypothetical protein